MKNDVFVPVVKTLFIPEGNPGVQKVNEIRVTPTIKNAEGDAEEITVTGEMEIVITYLPVTENDDDALPWKAIDFEEAVQFRDEEPDEQVLSRLEAALKEPDAGTRRNSGNPYRTINLNVPFTMAIGTDMVRKDHLVRIEPSVYSTNWFVVGPKAVEFETVLKLSGETSEQTLPSGEDEETRLFKKKGIKNEIQSETDQAEQLPEAKPQAAQEPYPTLSETGQTGQVKSTAGAQEGEKAKATTQEKAEAKQEETVQAKVAEQTQEKPAEQTQAKTAEQTQEKPAQKAQEKSVQKPAEQTQEKPAQKPVEQTQAKAAEQTQEKPAQKAQQKPVEQTQAAEQTIQNKPQEKKQVQVASAIIGAGQGGKPAQTSALEKVQPASLWGKQDYSDVTQEPSSRREFYRMKFYRVQLGEDLDAIADKLGVPKESIRKVNSISEEEVKTGLLLSIPNV